MEKITILMFLSVIGLFLNLLAKDSFTERFGALLVLLGILGLAIEFFS